MNKYLIASSIVFAKALTPMTGTAQTASPTFSPTGGTYSSCQSVTISDTTGGALIFYTTDGTAPNLASTRYTTPISVCSGQTLKAMAAVPVVNRTNAQTTSPSAPGTFWKGVATVGNGGNPGGTGTPTSTTALNAQTPPSLSGGSMLWNQTAQLNAQTNALWAVNGTFGQGDSATYFLEDHWYYWPGPNNASSNEDDDYQFDVTDNIRFMRGMQYCHTGASCPGGSSGWDYGGNSNVPWTNMGVTAGATTSTWHHLQKLSHRIPSEITSKPCSSGGSWPFNYVDALIIDGVKFSNGGSGWQFCANALPAGWSRVVGMQQQIDIGSHSTSTNAPVYWDNINYLATTTPSSTATATYIFAGIGAPVNLKGTVEIKGSATIQ